MSNLLTSSHRDKLISIALQKRAEPFALEVIRIAELDQLRIALEYAPHLVTWHFDISASALLTFNSEEQMVQYCFEVVDKLKKQAYADLYSKYGEYPDVRLWAIAHGVSPAERDIPGWVWPRVNRQYEGKKFLKTGGIVDKHVLEEIDINEEGREVVPVTAATKRSVKVVRPSNKTKKSDKPMCKIHTTVEMKFSQIRNLWECKEPDCNFVARPKGDAEAGSVRVGKGAVELRLIYTGEADSPRVVLMSDDNVVLDITDYVDIPLMKDKFDVDTAVRSAKGRGVEVTSCSTRDVPLRMALAVLGLKDYRS